MQNKFFKKGLVVGIIILFVGVVILYNLSERVKADNEDIDWWPMFQHDSSHTGYSSSTAPETNNVLWFFETNKEVVSSPVVMNGKLYFNSANGINCLDSLTGEKIWDYSITENWNSPAVYDGKVYIGTGWMLYCFNADSGLKIWEYMAGSNIESSATVVDGKVFFGASNYKVYCLNADNGLEIWNYKTNAAVWGSAAVFNGKVYIGSLDHSIYCLDAETGVKIWDYQTGNDLRKNSPTVVNSKVYFGSMDGKVYCLNAETGAKIWDFMTGNSVWGILATPAVAYGKVYIGSVDCNLYCLNAETGAKIWDFWTGESNWGPTSALVAEGKVYFGSFNNTFYCLNTETGSIVWNYEAGGSIVTAPAIADSKIYFGSYDGNLYCIGLNGTSDDIDEDNTPPVADFRFSLSNPTTDDTIQFYDRSIDEDGTIVLWLWDFGDGEISPLQNPSYKFKVTGTYAIKLSVTDDDGATDTYVKTLIVSQPISEDDEPDFANQYQNIMLTGFLNPTGQMIAQFSNNISLNPNGWKGSNWEGLGYNVYSFFPKPDIYSGDFELIYNDIKNDFNRIVDEIKPVAIISFGRGDGSIDWEIEYNASNLGCDEWILMDKNVLPPDPCPPDDTLLEGDVRHSTLPVSAIADAVKNQVSIVVEIDWDNDAGKYLCEYIAYLGMWYQSQHNSINDPFRCLASGFIHVSEALNLEDAVEATNVTIREVIKYLQDEKSTDINNGKGSPGFEPVFVLCAIVFILICRRKKETKN